MQCRERMGSNAVIPVVVLDDVKCAIPTARAILSGGIDIMEITLRTGLRGMRKAVGYKEEADEKG